MPARSPLNPRKKPRQLRSQATFDAILDAAVRILAEVGHCGLTTRKVADCAGVSVGSLYQYFPNKQVLLVETARRHKQVFLDALKAYEFSIDDPPQFIIRRLIQTFIRIHAEEIDFHRELNDYIKRSNRSIFADATALEAYDVYINLLARHPKTRNIPNPEMKILMIRIAIDAIIDEYIVSDPRALRTQELEDEMTNLVSRLLFCDGSCTN